MAETLSIISVISYIATGVFAITAIVLWFIFKIPTVIGDLSGKNAKKSIERLRKNNEKTGEKTHRTSPTNASRGKITETMGSKLENPADMDYETRLLNENKAKRSQGDVTGLLSDDEATGQLIDLNETEALEISERAETAETAQRTSRIVLTMIDEVMYIHTEEEI